MGRGNLIVGVLLFASACFHPNYDHPACGPEGECPRGLICSAQLICERESDVTASGLLEVWSLDSAADFAAPGYVVQDMAIEARGSLTPNAYLYGGLIAHGLQGLKLWRHGDTSWTKLMTVTADGAGLWRGESIVISDVLTYLGITDKAMMTVWFEGEVWLDQASTEVFGLDANDVAFIEIARPGTSAYVKVMENGAPVGVATPDTGWYPIRIGFADGDDHSSFSFTHSDSGTTQIPWTRDRLRARAGELSGVLRMVFGRQLLGGGQGSALPVSHLDEGDLLPPTTFTPAPQGAEDDDWSARYLGQVYIEQPGSYLLRITSDDGSRGRLGMGHAEMHWGRDDGTSAMSYAVPAMLAAGWNDVTVDYNQVAGSRRLGVQLGGPDVAIPVEVPRDRLRPVEPADDRLVVVVDSGSHTIKDNGGAGNPGTATMPVAAYAGETVTSIDLTYEVTTAHWDQLKVDLEAPGRSGAPGTRLAIGDTGGGDPDGIAQLTITSTAPAGLGALLGGPARGDWKLHVYDVVANGGDSLLTDARLTLHTTGGPAMIAQVASWTSGVLEAQTDVVAIDGVTWDERVPSGASLSVYLRTCRQADCSDGTWPAEPVATSAPFAVDPARYLQLRVDMTSDGTREPELRALSVMYRRAME